MTEKTILIRFSDTYATGEHDTFRSLEVSVNVPADSGDTDNDVTRKAQQASKEKLEELAREHARAIGNTEGIIANFQYDLRSGLATAELYLHSTPQKPTTSRIVKTP